MENFDLSRLTASAFERLIRALCFEKMGASGTVYSSGPDGARDFTLEGEIPSYEPRGWNGYLVVQAKFREKLQGNASDVQWLERQLRGELEKYTDRKANLKRPKYYIVATNVKLSGADGKAAKDEIRTGGHTKISTYLATWRDKLDIADFDIWPADKIIDLLADAPSVRETYAAWVTPGDVLSKMLTKIEAQNPDFASLIGKGLRESLRRDRHARLRDAGSVADNPIRVSQVFIDLPVRQDVADDLDMFGEDKDSEHSNQNGVVFHLTERSKEKLDPESVALARLQPGDKRAPARNRVVLLGGPGQGKSTASMFLAQLFRAELLRCDSKTQLDDNVRELVPEILKRADSEGISNNLPRRYPVFVSLPRFADAVSKAKSADSKLPSLLSHIALELSVTCDREFKLDDLRAWLRIYPWIAIFDGLDEVPPSGERKAIVEAIASFNSEVVDLQADVLVVVTTRPQGYDHDLDPAQWEHWKLDDLPPSRALEYAKALGYARYPSDPFRREDVLISLRDATTKPATSRLLISPLQVTIMYLIVDTGGSVPAARWSLFNEYFETLRKRERAKGGINQKVLERHWTQLAPIHQRAGLVLQTDSEHVGGALSALDMQRFTRMLHEFLHGCGYENEEIDIRINELLSVALDRLVLLSSKEEGKIAFDVRSLQEFMAAAAITSGNEKSVEDRLAHIANLSHWRHTFLIAASRCFSEDHLHHLRSTVVSIPRDLDSTLANYYVRRGANLSLEMFVDGLGADHPKSRKLLAQHALELLALGPDPMNPKLFDLFEEHTSDLMLVVLREKIAGVITQSSLAAWKLCVGLANRGHTQFLFAVEACWPSDPLLVLEILSILSEPLPTDNLVNHSRNALLKCKPSDMRRCSLFLEKATSIHLQGKPDHTPITDLDYAKSHNDDDDDDDSYMGVLSSDPEWPFSFSICGIDEFERYEVFLDLADRDDVHAGWTPLIVSAQFTQDPTREALGKSLWSIFEKNALAEAKESIRRLPWPIATIVDAADSREQLKQYAGDALLGKFGDVESWRVAEARWAENGLVKDDFLRSAKTDPFDASISVTGRPVFKSYRISHGSTNTIKVICELLELVPKMERLNSRVWMLEILQFAMLGIVGGEMTLPVEVGKSFFSLLEQNSAKLLRHAIAVFDSDVWAIDEIVKSVNNSVLRCPKFYRRDYKLPVSRVVQAYNRNLDCRGILLMLAQYMCTCEEMEVGILQLLDTGAFEVRDRDSPILRAAVRLLDLARGERPDSDETAQILCRDLESTDAIALTMVSNFLEIDTFLGGDRERYVLSILKNLEGKEFAQLPSLREQLNKILNAKRSNLILREIWIDKLLLPDDAYSVLEQAK